MQKIVHRDKCLLRLVSEARCLHTHTALSLHPQILDAQQNVFLGLAQGRVAWHNAGHSPILAHAHNLCIYK